MSSMRSRFQPRAGRRLPFLLLALLWSLALAVAHAQEGADSPPYQTAGPYRVAVQTLTLEPLVADVRFFVYVLDGATGQPVPEAQVRILTRHQAGGQEGWAYALTTPQEPSLFRANVHFDQEGVWESKVEVAGALGTVEVAGPASVVHFEKRSAAGGYVFLATALVLVGGGVYVAWRIRQAQARRQGHKPGDGTPLSIAKS
ncbi:MAG: hypothetical protein HY681_02850 [Chloroflexi bacterium]|nr:hypothetical protein [Chloroflexota bacterium]